MCLGHNSSFTAACSYSFFLLIKNLGTLSILKEHIFNYLVAYTI